MSDGLFDYAVTQVFNTFQIKLGSYRNVFGYMIGVIILSALISEATLSAIIFFAPSL